MFDGRKKSDKNLLGNITQTMQTTKPTKIEKKKSFLFSSYVSSSIQYINSIFEDDSLGE